MIGSQRCTGSHQKSQCYKASGRREQQPTRCSPGRSKQSPRAERAEGIFREASDWPFEQQKPPFQAVAFCCQGRRIWHPRHLYCHPIQNRVG